MAETGDRPMSEPEREKMFADLAAVSERIRTGEAESAEVATPHGTMRIYRDPENPESICVDAIGDDGEPAMRSRSWRAAGAPPAAYPDTLPFLRGCAAMVSEVGEGRMRSAMWMKPEDPEAAFDEVHRQVLGMGWEERPTIPLVLGMGPVHQAVFERDGREGSLRLVVFGEMSQLMWTDAEARRSGSRDAERPSDAPVRPDP
jgi:hypothetical protein